MKEETLKHIKAIQLQQQKLVLSKKSTVIFCQNSQAWQIMVIINNSLPNNDSNQYTYIFSEQQIRVGLDGVVFRFLFVLFCVFFFPFFKS